jgi:ketosteroid isomerase-like protein
MEDQDAASDGASDGASDVVERYLAAIATHDWDTMAGCVADDVVRVGPYGDTYRGRAAYVDFISALMPTLPGYHMEVARVVYGAGPEGGFAAAELTETVELGGAAHRTAESLLFDLNASGLIRHVAIYLRQSGTPPRLASAPGSAGPEYARPPT